jgi:hypothetical protein
MRLHPFEEWQTATQFDKKSYKNTPLPWWDAYNALKHRRYDNLRQATLKNAVLALAGLFIEMVATEQLAQALISTGWFSANNNNPAVCWDDELNSIQHNSICGETSLFAYPVGMWRTALRQNHGGWWSGNASFRFKTWYVDAHFPKSPVHPSHPRP